MNELTETQKIIPEHAKKIALAKMDLMKQWFEFRKKSNNKFKADYEFVQLYNTSNSNIFISGVIINLLSIKLYFFNFRN